MPVVGDWTGKGTTTVDKERYYISGAGYKKDLSAMQKSYNPDSAVNQGDYSNPNGDFIDRMGMHIKKSSCGTYGIAA